MMNHFTTKNRMNPGFTLSDSYKGDFMDTKAFREGFRDGIPIGLGYLAVSFSLGISAKQAGLTPLQGFVTSF